ncbi:hypothetical protein [Pelosinus baikalensis]|uniref:Uncharacterized protein n=1 Tax=Pelosinus baikalensis TaxID=2892015 RepID=A0ABS8HZ87_9FIRM|nr:hypothetical protein [Pelosinus baikalensis]MCC5468450.1 hypothetical protein [Pelosinus baikalensis]
MERTEKLREKKKFRRAVYNLLVGVFVILWVSSAVYQWGLFFDYSSIIGAMIFTALWIKER